MALGQLESGRAMSSGSAGIAAHDAIEAAELTALRKENAALRKALAGGGNSHAAGGAEGALGQTLDAMMTILDAQRDQIDKLHLQVSQRDDEIETLKAELQAATVSRQGIEEKLRTTATGFGRKMAQMEAKVLEAEKDVVLGGHVLVSPMRFAAEKDRSTHAATGPPKLPKSSEESDEHLCFPRTRILRPQASRSVGAHPRRSSPARRLEPLDKDGVRDAPSFADARLERDSIT